MKKLIVWLWLLPMVCLAAADEQWQLELGSGILLRQTVWRQADTQQRFFPLVMARYGNWRLGMENALLHYQQPLADWLLSARIGIRDETFDSKHWLRVRSDDPVYDGYRSAGGDTVLGLDLSNRWLSVGLSQDISGHSQALTATAHLIVPVFYRPDGPRAQLLAGGRWLSKDYSQHVFGVTASQSNALRPTYTPADAVNPQLLLQSEWPVSQHWRLRLRWQQEWYDQTLTNSPLTGRRVERQGMLMLSWATP